MHTSRSVQTLIWLLVVLALVYAMPNALSPQQRQALPEFMPNQPVSLGLDLQGGAYLLLQADLTEIRQDVVKRLLQDVRTTLRKENITANVRREGDELIVSGLSDRSGFRSAMRDGDIPTTFTNAGEHEVTLIPQPMYIKELEDTALARAIETVRKRIDESGTKDLTVQRQGRDQIAVQLPGVDDPALIKQRLGKTAKMTFHLVNNDYSYTANRNTPVPVNSKLLETVDNPDASQPLYLAVFRRALLSGETLIDAKAQRQEGEWVVSFRFNAVGGRKFGQITSQNVGKPFAIVLDDKVISAPRINEPIIGGAGIISGTFTAEEARELALLLRSGALPVPLEVVEERTVGAGLGADSIEAGKIAFIIGIIGVFAFMIAVYGMLGLLASCALLLNGILLLALLTAIGADLTMPGIAGIVLTMGMAVDSNILIYARMRDEAALGKPMVNVIKDGFSRAYGAIIDANITTLLSGGILYVMGTGPIKGFAATLSIGVITTLFTATILTKLLVEYWYRAAKPKALPI